MSKIVMDRQSRAGPDPQPLIERAPFVEDQPMQQSSGRHRIALLLAVLGVSALGALWFLPTSTLGSTTSRLPQYATPAVPPFLTLPSDNPTVALTEEEPADGFYHSAGSPKWSVENKSSGQAAGGEVWIRASIRGTATPSRTRAVAAAQRAAPHHPRAT